MERFGNSALQFSSSRQRETKTDLSTIALATVEADTCREYVVPTCRSEATRRRKLQATSWENVVEIFGKFGGADQLLSLIYQ
jgi:hypothetical protein